MLRLAQIGTTVLVAAAALLRAAPAHACSGVECTNSKWFPRTGTVPANLPGVLWWPSVWSSGAGAEDGGEAPGGDVAFVRWARIDGASFELLELELRTLPDSDENGPFLLVPKEPLESGADYVLWDATSCHAQLAELDAPPEPPGPEDDVLVESWVARLHVSDAAPLPSEFGSLRADEPQLGQVRAPHDAGCSSGISAVYSDLIITLSNDAAPWADALFYETEVDDRSYLPIGDYHRNDEEPGTPWVGRSFDRVYTACPPSLVSEGVSEGRHRAAMRASIPGTDVVLESDEVAFELRCPAAPDDDDAGTAEGDAAVDASTVDDAGDDGERDASGRPGGGDDSSDGGCNCSIRDRPGALSAAWPLMTAWAWLLVRRRRKPL